MRRPSWLRATSFFSKSAPFSTPSTSRSHASRVAAGNSAARVSSSIGVSAAAAPVLQQLFVLRHCLGRGERRMRRLFLVLALIGWTGLAAAQAPRPPADGTVECRFEGWSNDLDEKGQPVRAAPDAGATVVGRLPPPVGIGLDEVSVTVSVTGYRDGWFRIAEAGYSDEVQGVRVPRNRVVKATGWAPAREAATVAALSGFRSESGGRRVGFGPDGIAVKRLLACRGSWVEVETELGSGWVEKVCARQLGACP